MERKNYYPEKGPGASVMVKTNIVLMCLVCSFICLFSEPSVAENQKVGVRYAKGFSVEYSNNLTRITVHNPWPAANTDFCYVLIPRDSDPVTQNREEYRNCQQIETPVKRLVSLSTTHLAFLDVLGLVDRLVGFSSPDRVYTSSVRKAIEQNKIQEVGLGSNLRIETILDLNPDLILTYGTGTFRDAHPKLLEAGLKVAINGEYMETNPLGRAEWLKFVALFFNKGPEAEQIFSEMEKRYLRLCKLTESVRPRPTVLTNTPFSGRWHVARGNSFAARFLSDAGADYIWKDLPGNGSMPMDIEMVYDRASEAEFWVNPGIWTSLEQAVQSAPRMADFRSVREKRLYNRNKRTGANGANDYWESGMIKPDVILADLIKIFHPELLPEYTLYYYTKLP